MSTALRMKELTIVSSSLRIIHQCYIIDSCHSGQILFRTRGCSLTSDLMKKQSCVALCSARSDQSALEDSNGSIMVQAICETILSPDLFNTTILPDRNYITLESLVDIIREKTSAKAFKHSSSQVVVHGSLLPANEGSLLLFHDEREIMYQNVPTYIRPVTRRTRSYTDSEPGYCSWKTLGDKIEKPKKNRYYTEYKIEEDFSSQPFFPFFK